MPFLYRGIQFKFPESVLFEKKVLITLLESGGKCTSLIILEADPDPLSLKDFSFYKGRGCP